MQHGPFRFLFSGACTSILIGVVMLSLAGCGSNAHDYTLDSKSFDAKHLQIVEWKSGLRFADGSRGLNMYFDDSHVDQSFLAKVEVPLASKDELLNQIASKTNQPGASLALSGKTADWWSPAKTERIIERRYSWAEDSVHVFMCDENSHVILYVEWSQQ